MKRRARDCLPSSLNRPRRRQCPPRPPQGAWLHGGRRRVEDILRIAEATRPSGATGRASTKRGEFKYFTLLDCPARRRGSTPGSGSTPRWWRAGRDRVECRAHVQYLSPHLSKLSWRWTTLLPIFSASRNLQIECLRPHPELVHPMAYCIYGARHSARELLAVSKRLQPCLSPSQT